ncbi:cytochrome protein [Hyaloscypha sp. PMI_1271]|nr:cytochrome protein [Hyaloscypha sp. PMI_1271]
MAFAVIISLIFGKRQALPPGPHPKFLIGNLLDLPKPGETDSVTIVGQTLIIINNTQLAYKLMEKRSLKHSSRPSQVFAAFITYSKRFLAHRKQTAQVLGSKEVEVGRFLLRMLESPNDLPEHTRTEAGAIILKIAYGYTIEPYGSDPLVALAEKSFKEFGKAAVPGAWVVDMVQFLRYLPDWATLTDLTERPYVFVKHQMAQGKHESSFLSQLLGSGDLDDEETSVARWSSLSLYGGGAPQEEIDRNVGTGRLPGFQDRQNLPYIDAIVKEVLRWHPVAPMGLPHMTTEDDICEGYLIPKGALLLPNIWGFLHNPDVYHEPMEFKPERFLPTDGSLPEPDPHKLSFGFGRRICPG